jgi:predicted MFS family arabinose efflux permease
VQLPVAKWLEGRRRMAAYGVEGTIWAAAWCVVVFGIGECFHGTVQNALVTDLARPDLVGRYLALNGFAFQLGGAAGRAIGGFALATAPRGLWLAAAAAALAGGGFALLLERFIPPALRRTPVAVPA